MSVQQDLIVAAGTALYPAAISIIRLSGAGAFDVAGQVFRAYDGTPVAELPCRMLCAGRIEGGGITDEALCVRFAAGHGYTGEDCVEFHCHGGTALTAAVTNLLKARGARAAEAGEFSKRAFLNGKLDLTKAEGIIDLIDAESDAELRAGGNLLTGKLRGFCERIQGELTAILAEIDAACDYPDEYDGVNLRGRAAETVVRLGGETRALAETYRQGRLIKAGVNCVLTGGVNTGKSSLLNALLGAERAIVTAVPGTTRDTVTETLIHRGVKINLTDTAGLRENADPIERMGIERARAAAAAADIILRIEDVTAANAPPAPPLPPQESVPVIAVFNKCDLLSDFQEDAFYEKARRRGGNERTYIAVSAKTGFNLDKLLDAVTDTALGRVTGGLILTSERQRDALTAAAEALTAAEAALNARHTPTDVAYIDIRHAWDALGRVTGSAAGGEIIDALFSRFCVGK
jgi:tRNA modification GTPase